MGSGGDFEDWLDNQLHATLGAERGPRPRPADARYAAASRTGGTRFVAMRNSILAALSAKAVVGGAAAVALAAGGAVAAAAVTGSTDPANWGQHMVQVVEGCKDTVRGEQPTHPASAPRGIGECVSDAAKLHGQQQRAAHESEEKADKTPSPKPSPGKREGQESGATKGTGGKPASPAPGSAGQSGHGSGHSEGHPTPSPR